MNPFSTNHPLDSEARPKPRSVVLSSIWLGIAFEALLIALSPFSLGLSAIFHTPFWWFSMVIIHARGNWLIVTTFLVAAIGWSILFLAVSFVSSFIRRRQRNGV